MSSNTVAKLKNNFRLKETFPRVRERRASDTIAGAVNKLTIAQYETNVNNSRVY
jgi:hypothetical protein